MVTIVICFWSRFMCICHYKKVTFYLVENKRDVRGTKEATLSLHHVHSDIHYACKYINFYHFVFSKIYFFFLTESCRIIQYEHRSTDIPNAYRHIIVLYVSDIWISNKLIFNILLCTYCTWRPGPGTNLCDVDTDCDTSWHG